jgi:hypothetical protein
VDTLPAPDTLTARADSLAQADSLQVTLLPETELPRKKAPRRQEQIKELTD